MLHLPRRWRKRRGKMPRNYAEWIRRYDTLTATDLDAIAKAGTLLPDGRSSRSSCQSEPAAVRAPPPRSSPCWARRTRAGSCGPVDAARPAWLGDLLADAGRRGARLEAVSPAEALARAAASGSCSSARAQPAPARALPDRAGDRRDPEPPSSIRTTTCSTAAARGANRASSPSWNQALLDGQNYIGPCAAFRADLATATGGLPDELAEDGTWALFLRLTAAVPP